MKIILSTRNPSKAEQIQAIFKNTNISIITLADANIEGEAVEDGDTLQTNALKKALFAREHSKDKIWTMADDTGLFIDALAGEPGIKAARWAGETATTDEITRYTLKRLEGISNRSATFETAVAIVSPTGEKHLFSGKVRGYILENPRVKPQPKMPYSPIFMPEGEKLVWAEMSVEHENSISHRGKAFRQARAFLEKIL
jgi:XTP/dITP diphosphohydrolase